MRVALCLSGMVRTLMQTYPNLRAYLLEPLKPEVFVHTYDVMGIRAKDDEPVNESALMSMLSPKKLKIRKLADMDPIFASEKDRLYSIPGPVWSEGSTPESRYKLKNTLSMLWHVNQCDLLRREHELANGFEYDFVIRARMDSLFYSSPCLELLGKEGIFTSSHANYRGVCDQFAVGDCSSMAVYADYFEHFEDVWRSRVLMPDHWGVPETLLKRYLQMANIEVKTFTFPFDLQRPDRIEPIRHHTEEWFTRYRLGSRPEHEKVRAA